MAFAVVFTTIGALTVVVLIGRRPGTVAPSADGAAVADSVRGVVSPRRSGGAELVDPAVELGVFRGTGRPDERTADQVDALLSDRTWQDFVADVSHELKTPVGAVALLAEAVLAAAGDPDEVRRFSVKILNEANRLGTLVNELIALSRLQGAERLPELATVEIDKVVRAALDRCRLAAESANVRIIVDPPSGLLVNGEPTLLVSYSAPGGPVSVIRRLTDGVVEIAVADCGLGIAAEHQERVFERFFRIGQARSRSTGGTGLGWRSSNASLPTTVVTCSFGASPAPAPPSPYGSQHIRTVHNVRLAHHRHPST